MQKAFEDVAKGFKTRTGLEYTGIQLKYTWNKLKKDYTSFLKVKMKETGEKHCQTRCRVVEEGKESEFYFFCFSYQ
jgi:type II restriction/modification system DNA methylase subunit YeeA